MVRPGESGVTSPGGTILRGYQRGTRTDNVHTRVRGGSGIQAGSGSRPGRVLAGSWAASWPVQGFWAAIVRWIWVTCMRAAEPYQGCSSITRVPALIAGSLSVRARASSRVATAKT